MKDLWIIFAHCDSFSDWKLPWTGEHNSFWSGQYESQHRPLLELLLQNLGLFLHAKSCGVHATSPGSFFQRTELSQVLHSVAWWGQRTSENHKKGGVCAGDWLDGGCKSSFVPEPSTESCQTMLGNAWAFFSLGEHRPPHWKSRRKTLLCFCFGFALCEGNVALQGDGGGWVNWVRKQGSPCCFLWDRGIWPRRRKLFRTLLN